MTLRESIPTLKRGQRMACRFFGRSFSLFFSWPPLESHFLLREASISKFHNTLSGRRKGAA
jgi:hypothetical protein